MAGFKVRLPLADVWQMSCSGQLLPYKGDQRTASLILEAVIELQLLTRSYRTL
jgi:hypothetical protein